MSARRRPVVAVVGGGIAGLAAAWELVAGDAGRGPDAPEVHVFEAGDRPGGKIRAAPFGGRAVDQAADAFLARRPEAVTLCTELGIDEELVPVGASGASVLARGRLRALPAGLALGVPTRWWPLARSGLLGPIESARVARDVLLPHRGLRGITPDQAVGALVGPRLGRPVVERLVDPLIGGIHAGSADELSAAATFPVLIGAAHQRGSLMHALARAQAAAARRPGTPAPDGPVFWSLAGGTATLVDRLVDQLTGWGVVLHRYTPVTGLARTATGGRTSPGWQLTLGPSDPGGPAPNGQATNGQASTLAADGVVVAAPAPVAARLLAPHVPAAADLLDGLAYASVAVVTVEVPQEAVGRPLTGTGYLVPRTTTFDGLPALATGVTYLSRKWPHLARPGTELLRVSAGRHGDDRPADLDDDQLTAAAFGELARVLDISGPPIESMVTRWPGAFPQYPVAHLLRVARIEREVATLGAVAVAGAAYRGVGIPACIGSGREAAVRVRAALGSPAPAGTEPRPPGTRPGS